MAWISSHQGILNHPKTLDLMEIMGWDVDMCIAKLHRLWWWCVDYAEDGDLRKHNDDRIARAVGLNGGNEARTFVDGLVKAGWLDREPYFRVHDWWEHIGKYMNGKYSKTPEKWERIRDLYIPNVNRKVTIRLPHTTEQNRTEQDRTEQDSTEQKEKSKDKDVAGKFVPPSPQEVSEYGKTIGFPIDGEKFVAFYQASGWYRGKSKIKDWKAAVVTWKSKSKPFQITQKPIQKQQDIDAMLKAQGLV